MRARAPIDSHGPHRGFVAPLLLPPNPVQRFYRGGAGIDALRGITADRSGTAPEDWVGSATTVLGRDREGLAALADGRLVRDLLAADPRGYLGADHVARWGASPAVLVKLLDAGERLAAHYHPSRAFAREHLGSSFGKTEAWIILSARPGAHLELGLREGIDRATIGHWVTRQDSAEILAALNAVPISAGDVLLVPAGTIHTIGAGITLIELQEPADMSVVLEWRRYRVTGGEENLFLGWETVLDAAELRASTPIRGPRSDRAPAGDTDPHAHAGSSLERLLPAAADPYFRAQRATLAGAPLTLEPQYSVLIGIRGELTLGCGRVAPLRLTPGTAALIPFGAGETTLSGHGEAIRCLPPDPSLGPDD